MQRRQLQSIYSPTSGENSIVVTRMSNSSYADLPNPFNPLAYLPPDVARQQQVVGYMWAGTLAVSTAYVEKKTHPLIALLCELDHYLGYLEQFGERLQAALQAFHWRPNCNVLRVEVRRAIICELTVLDD